MAKTARFRNWELPEWLRWLLLPFTIIAMIIGAIIIILVSLFACLIGKREWAANLIEAVFDGFDDP